MHLSAIFVTWLIMGIGVPGLAVGADQATDRAAERTWAVGYGEADITPDGLQSALEKQLNTTWPPDSRLNLSGAETAAKRIANYLNG